MAKIVSVKRLDDNSYYQIVGLLPRCEWQEGMTRCTNQASIRIITDEEHKELCHEHYELYKKRYCRPPKQDQEINESTKIAKDEPP